ncbi:uncharacterized protein TNCV_4803651 [Trichonephila clavipes]|nr:uncharacterized protein TNCV_4803651 [Trichonephila clavipes]
MAPAVLDDFTRALQGTNLEQPTVNHAGWPWNESTGTKNDVTEVLSNCCCMRTSIILLENCPWETILGQVLHVVEEYHQRNVGLLRFHASQLKWTGNHRLCPSPQAVCRRTVWGNLYRSPGCLHTRTRLSSVPKTNRDSSLNTTFCLYVTVHIDLA